MRHYQIEAPEELRDRIRCFWYTSIQFCEPANSSFEVMPDGYVEIIFLFGSDCSIYTANGFQMLPSPFLMGLLNQPVNLHAQNRLEVIGVRCYPWTVFDLLGLSSGQDSIRVFDHPIAQLQSTLAEFIYAGMVDESLARVKDYFLNAQINIDTDSMLFKAGAALRKANGTMPISLVAAAAHATVRTLERNFKRSSGYTVKDVSAIMRFEQVRNHLWTYPNTNLAGLAQKLGYADQSHLSREFKRYSGRTPGSFARKAKVRKQTLADNFVAFVQS
jgi:AraC-like DNA-binding protein